MWVRTRFLRKLIEKVLRYPERSVRGFRLVVFIIKLQPGRFGKWIYAGNIKA
jgi:hypothetical protein